MISVAILIASTAFSQTKQKPKQEEKKQEETVGAKGWQAARWGLTTDELLKNFPEAKYNKGIEKFESVYSEISISAYKIRNSDFYVDFFMGNTSNKLEKVQLAYFQNEANKKSSVAGVYNDICGLLIAKYGRPSRENNDSYEWISGNTRIKLITGMYVMLQYEEIKKEDLDNL